MQILDNAISTGLFAIALWSAYAVVRTALELHAELRTVPLRSRGAKATGASIAPASRRLRRAA